MLAALVQSAVPGDCLLTGFCGVQGAGDGVASGMMFLAVGMVALGVWRIRAARRRQPQ